MNFFLKIINESKSRDLLRVNGASGLLYGFKWNQKLRVYAYQPKDQKEVDDLFKTMGRTTSYVFVPVAIEAPKAIVALAEIPPDVAKLQAQVTELQDRLAVAAQVSPPAEKGPLPVPLVEMALHRGVIVTDEDTEETVTRLVAAYDKGATAALNSLPAVTRKPRRPKPATPTPALA